MLTPITIGIITSGTNAIGPAMSEITKTNRNRNGRSTMAASDAEVKKSRSGSNCWTLLAKAPEDCGAESIRMPMTCWKIRLEILRSSCLPVRSRK